jgi:membrane-associated phospholipid phosphatase
MGEKIYTSPLHFSNDDWVIAGTVLIVSGVSMAVDNRIRTFWKDNKNSLLDNVSSVGYYYGGAINVTLLTSALYTSGIILKNDKLHKAGLHLLEGLVYAGVVTTFIKVVAGRSRPYIDNGPFYFKPFQFSNSHISFPSGHITVAFTISSVLSKEIDNTYATIGLYALAGSTFIQRMYDDKHWLSDSILGAAIGYFIGSSVVAYDKNSDNICFNAYLLPGETGLNFYLKF